MKTSDLQLKWAKLELTKIEDGFKTIRISSECITDIYIGINKNANRCLILSMPQGHKIDFQSTMKENLSIEYYKETDFIVLQLTDNTFYDLFDDFVLSLYQRIKDIGAVEECAKEIIRSFHKWGEFFSDKKSDKLSSNIIKGLFGELLVLKDLLNECNSSQINAVLSSWVGPFDNGHDFILSSKDIEVKTKDTPILNVRISSEYQLEPTNNKPLELWVISVDPDPLKGFSLSDLVLQIKAIIIEMLGDSSILLKAINQKSLTYKNIYEYDNLKYRPVNRVSYDCCNDAFPKLTKLNLPREVTDINYNLRLGSLQSFILFEKKL